MQRSLLAGLGKKLLCPNESVSISDPLLLWGSCWTMGWQDWLQPSDLAHQEDSSYR